MAIPSVSIGQFAVSTQNGGNQGQTSATALADGRVVISWQDSGSNGGDIKMRIFHADGRPAGPETLVNTSGTAGLQAEPEITWLATGGFVVAWEDYTAASGGGDIRYRVYNAAGAALTPERVAHSATAQGQQEASVIATADGGFMIGWWDGNTATTGLPSSSGAMLRKFNIAGAASSGAIRISGDWGGEFGPQLAASSDLQSFAAVWDDNLGPSSTRNGEDGLYWRSFTGFPGSFTDGGTRVDSGPFRESSRTPDIAMTATSPVIVWEDRPSSAHTADIWMRYDGAAPVRVNTTTADVQTDPHVTALALGGFVVVWEDRAIGDGGNIRARVYNELGVATSADFLVTSAARTLGVQFEPDVAALGDGRFMVTWSDQASSGIEAKIFDPRTTAVNMIGNNLADQMMGTKFNDTLRGMDGTDKIWGSGGNDLITGNNHADRIDGGTGKDTLFGGTGADAFIFSAPLALANADRLQDFSSSQGDDIILAASRFVAIGATLTSTELRFGAAAVDANDFLIYHRATGRLWYDRDGSGAATQVLVAVLDANTTLSLGNFEIQI